MKSNLQKIQIARKPVRRFVLIYEYSSDGKTGTCIDTVSPTVEASIANLEHMYGERLGRVWYDGALVRNRPVEAVPEH